MRRDCVCPRSRHEHGSRGAYLRDRCRCFPCRIANHYALASYKAGESWRECDDRLVPSLPTILQVRALMRIGYTAREVAERAGLTTSHVQNIRTDTRHPTVTARIAAAIGEVFDDWWATPSSSVQANRQRTKAVALGYPLPLQIDDTGAACSTGPIVDEVAVERRLNGDRQTLTSPELSCAVLTLHGKGWTSTAIARHLRMSGARVTQIIDRDEAA